MGTKWYVTTLIMKCKVGDQIQKTWLCDEQVRVLKAADEEEAIRKALDIGRNEEQSYANVQGELVEWKFVGIEDLEELSEEQIEDGTEIRSRLFRKMNPDSLVRAIDDLTIYRSRKYKNRTAYEIIIEDGLFIDENDDQTKDEQSG